MGRGRGGRGDDNQVHIIIGAWWVCLSARAFILLCFRFGFLFSGISTPFCGRLVSMCFWLRVQQLWSFFFSPELRVIFG